MKKTLLFACSLLFANLSFGQCTPDGSETVPGMHPTIIENIGPATVGVPYAQTLTIIIPVDTVVEVIPGFPTSVPITDATVTNVSGLPTGFSYACNVPSCVFPGGATNCAIITGTASPGQEGSYPLSVFVTYHAGVLSADDTVTGYVLNVNPVGLFEISKKSSLQMVVSPNPFSANADVNFYTPSETTMKVTVYNLLGKAVKTDVIRASAGENFYSLKGNTLQPGAYLLELNDGKNKITKKLIKE